MTLLGTSGAARSRAAALVVTLFVATAAWNATLNTLLARSGLASTMQVAYEPTLPLTTLGAVGGLTAATVTVVVTLAATLALLTAERRVAQLSYSMGTLVLIGGTTLHEDGPVGLTARLALDSAGPGATLAVAGYAAAAVVGYLALRRVVARAGLG